MKAIGIIGYKKSGKTSLLVELARELNSRGLSVSSIKSSSERLDFPETDTSKHKIFTKQTVAISPNESVIFFSEKKSLDQMLLYLNADIILIEGFKNEKTFPKIICLRSDDELELLSDGLEICIVKENINSKLDYKVPTFCLKSDISIIADLVVKKSFKLPGINCGACGYDSCYDLAIRIVNEEESIDSCLAQNPDVRIMINGNLLPIKPFISDFIRNTIKGMLSSLKNYEDGDIQLHIPKAYGGDEK
ncbi:MAG: molybdopterin-guanine dinucleotide biosynthesis protein B [bacterium]